MLAGCNEPGENMRSGEGDRNTAVESIRGGAVGGPHWRSRGQDKVSEGEDTE